MLSAQLLGATNEPRDGLAYYELEYAVAGSRGEYHHLARVAVAKGYLFVLPSLQLGNAPPDQTFSFREGRGGGSGFGVGGASQVPLTTIFNANLSGPDPVQDPKPTPPQGTP